MPSTVGCPPPGLGLVNPASVVGGVVWPVGVRPAPGGGPGRGGGPAGASCPRTPKAPGVGGRPACR